MNGMNLLFVYLAGAGAAVIYWTGFMLPKAVEVVGETRAKHPETMEGNRPFMLYALTALTIAVLVAGLAALWPVLLPVKIVSTIVSKPAPEILCPGCGEPLDEGDHEEDHDG